MASKRIRITLMEVLVVLAVIVVLASIAVAVAGQKIETGREAEDVANMRVARLTALEYMRSEGYSKSKKYYFDVYRGVITNERPEPYGKGTRSRVAAEFAGVDYDGSADYTDKVIEIRFSELQGEDVLEADNENMKYSGGVHWVKGLKESKSNS